MTRRHSTITPRVALFKSYNWIHRRSGTEQAETLVWTMRYETTILHRASRPVPLFIFPLFALRLSSLLASPLLFSLVHSRCLSCTTRHSSSLTPNLTPLRRDPSPLVVRLPSSLFLPLPLSASLCFSIYCLCPPRRLSSFSRVCQAPILVSQYPSRSPIPGCVSKLSTTSGRWSA